jgi:hypothetical protein
LGLLPPSSGIAGKSNATLYGAAIILHDVRVGITAIGYSVDAFNYGVGMEFVDEVSRNLTPGKSALVAEVDEYWTIPLGLRMEALGGIVVRQWRLDVEQDLIHNEIRAGFLVSYRATKAVLLRS